MTQQYLCKEESKMVALEVWRINNLRDTVFIETIPF